MVLMNLNPSFRKGDGSLSEGVLREGYEVRNMTVKEVAKRLRVGPVSVHRAMVRYGIPRRVAKARVHPNLGKHLSATTRARIGDGNRGQVRARREASASWKGGRIVTGYGYVKCYFPDHPRASKHGYVSEHILVAEKSLGRPIDRSEVVHHVNGIRNDNRPENLQVMSREDHTRFHAQRRVTLYNELVRVLGRTT